MISNNRGRSSGREEHLDELLVDFFAREMPVELRELSPTRPAHNGVQLPSDHRLPLVQPEPIAPRTGSAAVRGRSARAVSLVAVGVVVLVATALFRGTPNETDETPADRTASPETSRPASSFAATPPNASSDGRDEFDGVTYDAATGPLERPTSAGHPATGAKIEVELEMLEIEIIPIDD